MASSELPVADAGLPYADELADILGESQDAGRDAGPVVCAADPSPLRALQISVRTVSASGRFRPRNAGAIWIERDDGTWVKTVERWGVRRAKWLTAFNESSGGDVTDAITSATLPMHRVHELTWDLTDKSGCEIDNGSYLLRLELTDMSSTGETASVPFEKADDAITWMPEDQAVFRDMSLRLE